MLEKLAHQYLTLGDGALLLILIVSLLPGVFIALLTNRSESEMPRAPFFATVTGIHLALTLAHAIWLKSPAAIVGGYLWTLIAATMAANGIAGYFIFRAAMARSRDAFGGNAMGFLVFAPILNLWLQFKGSRNPDAPKTHDRRSPLSGGLGVFIGLVFSALSVAATTYVERVATQGGHYSAEEEEALIAAHIASKGLESALTEMSRDVALPVVLDEVTRLISIEASPSGLRRTYIIADDGWAPGETFRQKVRAKICALPAFRAALRSGGSFVEHYEGADGATMGEIVVAAKDCGLE